MDRIESGAVRGGEGFAGVERPRGPRFGFRVKVRVCPVVVITIWRWLAVCLRGKKEIIL